MGKGRDKRRRRSAASATHEVEMLREQLREVERENQRLRTESPDVLRKENEELSDMACRAMEMLADVTVERDRWKRQNTELEDQRSETRQAIRRTKRIWHRVLRMLHTDVADDLTSRESEVLKILTQMQWS